MKYLVEPRGKEISAYDCSNINHLRAMVTAMYSGVVTNVNKYASSMLCPWASARPS